MNGLQDLQDKLFLDIQNIIQDLSEINSLETLLQDDYLIRELAEKAAFLKLSQSFDLNNLINIKEVKVPSSEILEEKPLATTEEYITNNNNVEVEPENIELEEPEIEVQSQQEQLIQDNIIEGALDDIEDEELLNVDDNLDLSDNEMFKDDIEEELEVEKISPLEEILPEAEEIIQDEKLATHTFEAQEESQFSFAMEKQNTTKPEVVEEVKDHFISEISISEASKSETDQRISEKEQAFLELEARRKQIIEETQQHEISENEIKNDAEEDHDIKSTDEANLADKKIKLSNIKGVSKTLFDDDLPENSPEEKLSDSGSLARNNRPTSYMEAPKPKQEFRLDLNDKIAFTQHLFNNSQMDLNHVVNRLNSFDNLEQAKEFLSDLYYQKNWEKVDGYAQRLWILVENKFL